MKEASERIKPIEMTVQFDESAAWQEFLSFIEQEVKNRNPDRRIYRDLITRFMTDHRQELLSNKEEFLSNLKNEGTQNHKFMLATFTSPCFFQRAIYRYYQSFSNVLKFGQIKISYDGRELTKTSFGQRCTAVLMILLSRGNNPIMIDEPEGHLDSPLIANEIVDVLKKVKRKRQVILATHNANIVINGDAELVNLVTMDQHGRTKVTPTCIEDLSKRIDLLNLEGGAEAFQLRENKILKGYPIDRNNK